MSADFPTSDEKFLQQVFRRLIGLKSQPWKEHASVGNTRSRWKHEEVMCTNVIACLAVVVLVCQMSGAQRYKNCTEAIQSLQVQSNMT